MGLSGALDITLTDVATGAEVASFDGLGADISAFANVPRTPIASSVGSSFFLRTVLYGGSERLFFSAVESLSRSLFAL